MPFTVATSHRLEDLFDALVADLARDRPHPLAPETILVPGRGLAKWLQLRLAERLGIAAGLRLPFVGAFVQQLTAAHSAPDLFAKDVLALRLWRLFAAPAADFGEAAAYWAADRDCHQRWQLCQRLAACFDDYQLYRDDLLLAFARGDDGKRCGPHGPWQARLWRALLADAGIALGEPGKKKRGPKRNGDRASGWLFAELQQAPAATDPASDLERAHRLWRARRLLDDPDRASAALPHRVSVFGTTTLPPAVLDLLQRIAVHVPVRLYVPQPTPHYLGDMDRRRAAPGDHPLLAQCAGQSRDFTTVLERAEQPAAGLPPLVSAEVALPDLPAPRTLLACLQHDLVLAEERASSGVLFPLAPDDDSLRVHDCHSPQRELEVVRDQICAALAADASLQLHDVQILVPDLERYAPYAHAVFGPTAETLPFFVADRHPAHELPVCRAVLRVLELATGRLRAFDVLHLLEEPAIQRRFQLTSADLPVLRQWCWRAGIRWGEDGAMRHERFDLPPFDDYGWQQGLARLLLGALTGAIDDEVLGHVPVADATESRLPLLTRFLAFSRALFGLLDPLRQEHSFAAWADTLDALAAALFAPDGGATDQALQRLRQATARLRAIATAAAHTDAVPPRVLRDWLTEALGQDTGSAGFLGGSLTIAAMLPMRAVPVRCLFVCGLDDESFPRTDHPCEFDLIAPERRPGDRSRRLDDRQLFLDLLLAARERLHLTYVGRSAKDNSYRAPSVVLSELLDHLAASCRPAPGFATAREQIVVQHPLQPWSARYLGGQDARLFTWQATAADPTPGQTLPTAPPFVPPDFLVARPVAERIDLDEFLEFWRHPCRAFLRRTLQVTVRNEDDRDEDSEPFALDGLARYLVADELVHRALWQPGAEELPLALARARFLLPVGAQGEAAFQTTADTTALFVAAARASGATSIARVRAAGSGFVLEGDVGGLAKDHVLRLRPARIKPSDHFTAWVLHLVLAQARRQGAALPDRTRLLGRADEKYIQPEPNPEPLLDTLVQWYRTGLCRPLLFFPRASHDFAKTHGKAGGNLAARLRAARGGWTPDPSPERFGDRDAEDPAIALCMRGRDPLCEEEFRTLADELWLPALNRSK